MTPSVRPLVLTALIVAVAIALRRCVWLSHVKPETLKGRPLRLQYRVDSIPWSVTAGWWWQTTHEHLRSTASQARAFTRRVPR